MIVGIRLVIFLTPETIRCYFAASLQVACRRLTLLLTMLVASGCAWNGGPSSELLTQSSVESSQSPSVEPTGQVLINIRLEGRFDLPQGVAIDYSYHNTDSLQSSVGILQRGLSGHYGDYVILLKLPAGHYRLRSLRIAGLPLNAKGALVTRLNKHFDTVASETRYIGRLIVSSNKKVLEGRPSVSWHDHYNEDSLLAKSLGNSLRGKVITNASNNSQLSSDDATGAMQITVGTVGDLGSTVLYALASTQKPSFRKFLSSASPRAFAVGDAGAAGFANGRDAVKLALERCGRRGDRDSCRILAIDDTVVLTSTAPNS